MRIQPDRQTLILAGEALPRRNVTGSGNQSSQRVTIISARVDAVVTQGEYTPNTGTVAYDSIDDADFKDVSPPALPVTTGKSSGALASRAYSVYASANRTASFGGASAYARTQDLSERHPIIDTYA